MNVVNDCVETLLTKIRIHSCKMILSNINNTASSYFHRDTISKRVMYSYKNEVYAIQVQITFE